MPKTALKQSPIATPPSKLLKKVRALQNRGQFQNSLKVCEKLETQGYRSAELFHFHGLALQGCNRVDEAFSKLNSALELDPDNARIYNSLGAMFLHIKDVETAIDLFKHATSLDQKFYDAWLNLGAALRAVERFQAAIVAFNCAHHNDKKQIAPLLSVVHIYLDVRQYTAAEELMDRILTGFQNITPSLLLRRMLIAVRLEDLDYLKTHLDTIAYEALSADEQSEHDHYRAYYLESTGRNEEAIELLEKCIRRGCARERAFTSHLGLCYADDGRFTDAIQLHEQILEKHPDFTEGRYNLAFLQFKNGDLENGYKNFESRWQWREFPSKRRLFDAPQWNGESLEGKNLLVWREQGIGDEVRYASLLQDLKEQNAHVTFECSPKLKPVWEHSFPWLNVTEEGHLNCINDPQYSTFDYQIPVASLANVLRPTIQSYDELQTPWIKREEKAEQYTRDKLGVASEEMLVGLCWRSSNQIASRDKYFLSCEQLKPLAEFSNTRWLNVQYDAHQHEIDEFRNFGMKMHHFTDVDQKEDIATACKLLGACDLVISIGGSVADLAGGLGVPMIYMTARNSEVYLGTDYVPWFQNCKSYPIDPFKGSATIERVVNDFEEISNWAKSFSDRKPGVPENRACSLDLNYHAS